MTQKLGFEPNFSFLYKNIKRAINAVIPPKTANFKIRGDAINVSLNSKKSLGTRLADKYCSFLILINVNKKIIKKKKKIIIFITMLQ